MEKGVTVQEISYLQFSTSNNAVTSPLKRGVTLKVRFDEVLTGLMPRRPGATVSTKLTR